MKPLKPLTIFILAGILILEGCSTQNKFASSFGKRRYTKGFYVDVPGNIKQVTSTRNRGEVLPMPALTKAPQLVISKEKAHTHEQLQVVAIPAITHKPSSSSGGQINVATSQPGFKEAFVPAIAAIKSHEYSKGDNSGHGTYLSILGLIVVILSMIALYAGLIMAASGSLFGGEFFLFGLLGDIAGIVICVLALVNHDPQPGFAIAGLLINLLPFIILGLAGIGI